MKLYITKIEVRVSSGHIVAAWIIQDNSGKTHSQPFKTRKEAVNERDTLVTEYSDMEIGVGAPANPPEHYMRWKN